MRKFNKVKNVPRVPWQGVYDVTLPEPPQGENKFFEAITGYSLWANLLSCEGGLETDIIDLGDGWECQIKIMYDDSPFLIEDDFGVIKHTYSNEEYPEPPDDNNYLIESDGYHHIWLIPEWAFEDRKAYFHKMGVAKHDAALMARNSIERTLDNYYRLESGLDFYYGYEVTVYHDGVKRAELSSWGFLFDSRKTQLDCETEIISFLRPYTEVKQIEYNYQQ